MASVHNNTYKPLSRPLFIYAKGSSFKRKEVQAFLDYLFDNELKIAARARFVPLTKVQLKRARTNFALAVKAAEQELSSPSARPVREGAAHGAAPSRIHSRVLVDLRSELGQQSGA